MCILTAVFAEATRRHAITALTQRQAQFTTLALVVVDIVLACLPNSKKDPKVQLQIRHKLNNELRTGSALNIVYHYAEEIKIGAITHDEVRRAVLAEVRTKGLKAILANNANKQKYPLQFQLQSYKTDVQQLFAAELATSTFKNFIERHSKEAVNFWDDNQAPQILKTRLIEDAIEKSVALSELAQPDYLSTCKKIPNGAKELVKALILHYMAQFNAGVIHYYELRDKIDFKNIEEELKQKDQLKQPLKGSFLKYKNEGCLHDKYAKDRKLLEISFEECLEGLPEAKINNYRTTLKLKLTKDPTRIPENKDQMDALKITCQSIYVERWRANYCTLREIVRDLTNHKALELLEEPRQLKKIIINAMQNDADNRFLAVLHYYPALFELVFTPQDQEVVAQINADLLVDEYAMHNLCLDYAILGKGFVKNEVIEALLKRHYLKHLSDYCDGKDIPYANKIAQHQLLQNTNVGKIILEIGKEAEKIRQSPALVTENEQDRSNQDLRMKRFVSISQRQLTAFKANDGSNK